MRSSSKVFCFEVTDPVPPSPLSCMFRVYVPPLLTSLPVSRTASAASAAARAFLSICSAVSLPTPLVPLSGSSPAQAVSATVSPAQSTTAKAVRRRARTAGAEEVTGALPLVCVSGVGRPQRTRAAYAVRQSSVRTVRQRGTDRYGLA